MARAGPLRGVWRRAFTASAVMKWSSLFLPIWVLSQIGRSSKKLRFYSHQHHSIQFNSHPYQSRGIAEIPKVKAGLVLQSKLLTTLSGRGKGTREDGTDGGIRIGKVFSQEGCFSFDEVQSYTHVTGDSNPIHVDVSAAQEAGFDSCLVPGMLCGSLFPAIIGSRFQAGAIYVSQELKFKAPLLVGQSFLAEVEIWTIVKLRQHAKVTFFTRCLRDREDRRSIFLDGQAIALVPMSFIAD